jgi:hypothetical protein
VPVRKKTSSWAILAIHATLPRRRWVATLVAIAWSFIRLRRKKDFDVDAEGTLNPVYMIVASLIGLMVFIGTLISFVKMAVPAS